MLHDLAEYEGRKAILAATNCVRQIHSDTLLKVFGHLDYLFYGRAQSAPNVWIAGALTRRSVSVTGSGRTLEGAFFGVAGETAETSKRAGDIAAVRDPLLHGYGSHTVSAKAARHARCELIERICVTDWWRGGHRGELWDREQTARALDSGGQVERTPDREVHIIDVTMWPKTAVIVALSFDCSGYGFCFGAACHTDKRAATYSATNELVQSEFGLQLALMKQERFGTEHLSAKDRLTLLHARKVDRNRILTDDFIASPGAARSEAEPLEACPLLIELRNLGIFEGRFHVMEASAEHSLASSRHALTQPSTDVPLY